MYSLPITTVTNGSEPPTVVDTGSTGCVGTSHYLTDIRAEDPPPPTITFIPYADGEIKVHTIIKADFFHLLLINSRNLTSEKALKNLDNLGFP